MDTLLIVLLVVLLLGGGGAGDTLVGAGSARGALTCPRKSPHLEQKPI